MSASEIQDGPLTRLRRRHGSDVVRVLLGLLTVAVASLPVRPDAIGRVETGVFDAVNGLPDLLYPLLWVPMQLGSLAAVPLVMLAAVLTRRGWLAVEAALAGTAAWMVAKVVKDAFGRPRPGGLLDEVVFRGGEPIGFGFVSGHSAVAFALATAATLYLPRRWRARVLVLAGVVGLARMFVGAHLPLDVIGGAGLGWAIAAAVRLALGAATGRPTLARVQAGIARLLPGEHKVVPLRATAGTSALFRATGTAGDDVVAKVLSDRPQDRDLLYRLWIGRGRRLPSTMRRFASPSLQVSTEATVTLAAAAAGVRVPAIRFAGALDADTAVLISGWLPGQPLDAPEWRESGIRAAALDDLARQVGRMHAAGIAHGDLVAANVLVDGDHVALLDFGEADLLADDQALAADHRQLAVLLEQFGRRGESGDAHRQPVASSCGPPCSG